MDKHNPYIVDIHCMAQQCNLFVQIMSSFIWINRKIDGSDPRVESLFHAMYYYSHSPNKTLHKHTLKLVEVIESKFLKNLRNIKTRWISLFIPSKWCFIFIFKASYTIKKLSCKKYHWSNLCATNFKGNLQILSKLTLEVNMHSFDTFVAIVMSCQIDLYAILYIDPN